MIRRPVPFRAQLRDPEFFHEPEVPTSWGATILDAVWALVGLVGAAIVTVWGVAGWLFVLWLIAGVVGR